MKQRLAFFILPVLLLCACSRLPDTYQFPNQSEPIATVEFLHNRNPGGVGIDESNMFFLYALNEAEIDTFMDALYALPTERNGTPPSWGYGPYIAKVTYENGDIEMYGLYNMEYIPCGGEMWGIGDFRFSSSEDFVSLLAIYIDLNQLPAPPPL